MESVL